MIEEINNRILGAIVFFLVIIIAYIAYVLRMSVYAYTIQNNFAKYVCTTYICGYTYRICINRTIQRRDLCFNPKIRRLYHTCLKMKQ